MNCNMMSTATYMKMFSVYSCYSNTDICMFLDVE